MNRNVRIVVFTERIAGITTVIARKRLSRKHPESIRYRKRTFSIVPSNVAYATNKRTYYIVDMKEGQLTIGEKSLPVSAEFIDTILSREMGRQLVSGLSTGNVNLMAIILMIVGLGAGVPIGMMLGQYLPM